MKILSLTVIAMYFNILAAFSQTTNDSVHYKMRKLQLEEIDFVSAYYKQDGNNSAVTGGTGTEKLTDVTNTIELKLLHYDKKKRKNQFRFELGVDHYTSASSDKIDPKTISSASMDDTRIYPTLGWSRENEKKGTSFGVTASYSKEADYVSHGTALNFTKTSADRNKELTITLQAYLDQWKVIYPSELKPPGYGTGAKDDDRYIETRPRNSFTGSLSYSRIVNKRLQISLLMDPTFQQGLLSTTFHRVYFFDGSVRTESLPGRKLKIPIGLRSNYFFGDHIILRTLYRYYWDDWGMTAHSVELECPVKFSQFVSISPFYRFHSQQQVDYFSPYSQHRVGEDFYTSDYDLSSLNSHFFGLGLRLSPPKGVLGMKAWNLLELRYGHYNRSTNLQSDVISVHVKFK